MKVTDLAANTGITSLNDCPDREVAGVYISDMVSDIITGAMADYVLVTLQTHKSLIASANLVDVSAIVFTRGKKPGQDVVDLATKAGIGLFVSDADTWTYATKLYEAGLR